MKKRDFQATVKNLVVEHYKINEEQPFNDAGEPTMTHQQYRDYSEPAERDPDDMQHGHSADDKLSAFQAIDWKELFAMAKQNTDIFDRIRMVQDPKEQSQLRANLTSISEITDANPEERGFMTHMDIGLLGDAGILYLEDNYFSFDGDEYADYDRFVTAAKKTWDAVQNGTYQSPNRGNRGNDSEAPYMRGYEPMSEEFLGAVYEHFKAYLKEGITKLDFAKKIRGVVYEYAQGVPSATPTTADPVRDPDNIKQQGKDMQDIGKKIEDVGKTAEDIKNKNAVRGSVSTPTLREYVEEAIFPAVLEIMKEAERPRATKRELLEMFKLGK